MFKQTLPDAETADATTNVNNNARLARQVIDRAVKDGTASVAEATRAKDDLADLTTRASGQVDSLTTAKTQELLQV